VQPARILALLALTGVVAFSTGCGGSSTTSAPDAVAPATPAPTQSEQTAGSTRAVPVPEDLLEAIASGEESGAGMKPIRGVAVKSEDFSEVYMVAMEFSAAGVENQIGVWATNSLTSGGGIIMAVDGTAQAFTVWPDADETDAAITDSDDGVAEARSALEAN